MLRDADTTDLDAIRRWRNDERVRAVSLTAHEIGPDEHLRWWRRASTDPTRRVLVYERDGVPSGVVNFFDLDPAARTVAWGFFLDLAGLDERAETLPAWLEIQREALDFAFDVLGVDVLTGEVLEHNTIVRRMNRRFGFTEGEPAVHTAGDRVVRVYPIRLHRDDRRTRTTEESTA
ncbi:MAG: GNAT family N-acetyltransferase [Streptosporangiales bacterium]|nr:GNAT family N-acetyltransferase [Streptosporangiales bacterium]MBO0889352.1 GNAT family N-acetyltransferase [Acidothermales bacterium]